MKKVLIVDDTKNIRMLLTTCLELEGYETITAKNGQEALELFETKNIDLAFLDIKMPELSGTEVLRKVRGVGINTPIVIMTAFATVKNAVECTRLGAVAYLQKPFTAEKVRNLLSELETVQNDNMDDLGVNISNAMKLIEELKLDESLNLLKKTLALDIQCSETYYLIARVYELKGEVKEAKSFYNMAEQFKQG
jgi:DNA-binding NtrC family response regulator